jgi:hypothetical protein
MLANESAHGLAERGPDEVELTCLARAVGMAGFQMSTEAVRNAEHVELGWFTPSEARELNLADPAYLELFARVDALNRGRR